MSVTAPVAPKVQQWHELAQQLRVDSIRCSTAAGSGHPTSSMSAADLMAVLLASHLRYDFGDPANPNNDHLIFSKGHASPLLYSVYKAAGAIGDDELMAFRKFGSRTQGHPVPVLPWVDVGTGSLGQGLPIGVGIALAGKYLDKLPYRTWVLLGDSEMAEGSQWEAFDHASHYELDNLTAVLDMNRLGQRGPTALGWNSPVYAARARAFGWHAIEIDGHDPAAVDRAYSEAASHQGQPTLIVAKTIKGAGVSFLENKEGWHGKALKPDEADKAIQELGGQRSIVIQVGKPEALKPAALPDPMPVQLPRYNLGEEVATRKAYGEALKALGDALPDVVALDGEVSNSTFAEDFAHAHPDRFFEQYIAEQQMIAAAVGLSVRHKIAFASTFAAFVSRAYDFIRMAAVSRAHLRLCGSHAGVSIGEDGPSQMALEDLAMMRAVWGSTVLYPSDANQTAHLVEEMAHHHGISFLRTTREKTPIIYEPDEKFPIGGCKVVRSSAGDKCTVVGAGITLHQALEAYERLKGEGTSIRVVDLYSVKPADGATLSQCLRETGGKLVTVEDHWAEGGLGDAVLAALSEQSGGVPSAIIRLAVRDMPGSGKPQELLDAAGIGANAIVEAVNTLVR
jgi:transketolase